MYMPVFPPILVLYALATSVVCLTPRPSGNTLVARWVIEKNCTVRVNGRTNVNTFSCSVPGYSNPDTINCYKSNGKDVSVTLSGRMALPVNSFDCGNGIMTNDLRKTLKAKEYPVLNIDFLSLQRFPLLQATQEAITGVVNIELAGVTKRVEVNYQVSMDEQKIIHLTGTQCIYFSDFHLTPPRKLGGMIRTDDKLDVLFTIHCKMIAL